MVKPRGRPLAMPAYGTVQTRTTWNMDGQELSRQGPRHLRVRGEPPRQAVEDVCPRCGGLVAALLSEAYGELSAVGRTPSAPEQAPMGHSPVATVDGDSASAQLPPTRFTDPDSTARQGRCWTAELLACRMTLQPLAKIPSRTAARAPQAPPPFARRTPQVVLGSCS